MREVEARRIALEQVNPTLGPLLGALSVENTPISNLWITPSQMRLLNPTQLAGTPVLLGDLLDPAAAVVAFQNEPIVVVGLTLAKRRMRRQVR